MSLVTPTEVAKALNIEQLGSVGRFMAKSLMKLSKIDQVNQLFERHKHLEAIQFVDAVLEDLGVKFEIPDKDLKRIPSKGAFITISNHPLGGVDGLLLMKILWSQREDFKIIANFLLQRLTPLEPKVLPVNPFEDRKEVKSSLVGIKNALLHLSNESPFGIFPSGEVSSTKEGKDIVDQEWSNEAIRLIKKAKVPVLPIYFHAKNSPQFYQLSQLNKTLRLALLPREVYTQKNRMVKMRVGNIISVKEQTEIEDVQEFKAFLRRKTYMLSSAYEKKRLLDAIPKQIKLPRSPKEIIGEGALESILEEVEQCRVQEKRLLVSNNYEVFLAKKELIPNILMEIGRLREITFRLVGEGTNKAIDLDAYDAYYYHMFLWDNQAQKIAGAYRMGLGNEIFEQFGIQGFYLNELFRFEIEAQRVMRNSIEMGRAFIIPEYQQRPMPLFLLWKGIVHCTIRFPEHKYLIGGVSISNKFSNFSKSMMIEFMKSNYYDPYLAQFIHPKKEFKVKLKDADKDFVFDHTQADLNKFDKIIDEIEPDNLRLPVLIKKYIKQNARVVAFNVDPLFNNAIDGLMYIRVKDLPESTVKPVLEELQKELEDKVNAMNENKQSST
jgi:putative hemolysin